MAAGDDVVSQALWRSALASILARRGRPDEAGALAEEAVALLRATDGVVKQADALATLSEVLAAAGRQRAAEAAAAEALALYAAKGNRAAADKLRSSVAELIGLPS